MRVRVVDVEGRPVRVDGGARLAQLGLFEHGDRVQRLHPIGRIVRVVEGVTVELHAVARTPRLAKQAVDRLEAPVAGLRLERVRPPEEDQRAVDVLLSLEQLAGALREPRGRRLVRRDLVELRGEDLR